MILSEFSHPPVHTNNARSKTIRTLHIFASFFNICQPFIFPLVAQSVSSYNENVWCQVKVPLKDFHYILERILICSSWCL